MSGPSPAGSGEARPTTIAGLSMYRPASSSTELSRYSRRPSGCAVELSADVGEGMRVLVLGREVCAGWCSAQALTHVGGEAGKCSHEECLLFACQALKR